MAATEDWRHGVRCEAAQAQPYDGVAAGGGTTSRRERRRAAGAAGQPEVERRRRIPRRRSVGPGLAHDQRGRGEVDRPRSASAWPRRRRGRRRAGTARARARPARGCGRRGRPAGRRRSATRPAFVASKSTMPSRSFGRTPPSGAAVDGRPQAALGHPLLAAAEVAHVAEADVVERRPVGERDRDAAERQAALRVERPVDRIDHDHPSARRLRTAARPAPRTRAGSRSPPACSSSSLATTAASASRRSRSCRRRPRPGPRPARGRRGWAASASGRATSPDTLPAEAEPALPASRRPAD